MSSKEFRRKTFTIDWSKSQGGDIIDEQGNKADEKDHPSAKMWQAIFKHVTCPVEYTTQEFVDWINQGINLFGIEIFKKAMESMSKMKAR